MTVLIIVAAVNGLMLGYILGALTAWRGVDRDVEMAYLTGHVDGYGKAMHDAGVPE